MWAESTPEENWSKLHESVLSHKGRAKTTERAQVGTEVTQPGMVQGGQMEEGVFRAEEVGTQQTPLR